MSLVPPPIGLTVLDQLVLPGQFAVVIRQKVVALEGLLRPNRNASAGGREHAIALPDDIDRAGHLGRRW